MNPKVKKAWIKALLSGKYKQGRKYLRRAGKYCCLGVLCDISGLSKWKGNSYLGDTYSLPRKVYEWARLEESNPGVSNQPIGTSLAELNDHGMDFKQIAKIIKEQL